MLIVFWRPKNRPFWVCTTRRNCQLSFLPTDAQEIEIPGRAREGWHQRYGQTPSWKCLKPHGHRYHFPGPRHHLGYSPASYSPDFAPCDIFLFLRLKREQKKKHRESVKNVQKHITTFIRDIPVDEFQSTFQAWQTRLRKSVGTGR